MNVFLPDRSIYTSVSSLDDRRLNKQILEIAVLMSSSKGYNNHPVKVFYKDKMDFLAHYGYICCCEYYYRFEKLHKLYTVFENYLTTHGGFNFVKLWWKEGLYAEGSKNSSTCIRETDPIKVCRLFKQKLINKWKNDKIPPRWTKSSPPDWYKKEEI